MKELLKFIAKAHKNTYAAPKKIKCKSIIAGHKDYDFVDGDWRYHDSYSGWVWPPGKEIVFYKNKPVWCMSYQGKALSDSKEFIEKVYGFLKKALMKTTHNLPFRCPKKFKQGDFEYTFKIKGDYSYFTGREAVKYKGKEVFFQDVMGSLIK